MKSIVVLDTSGYKFILFLSSLSNSKDRIGVVAYLKPNQKFSIDPIRSEAKAMFLEDLKKLFVYLEKHIENNLQDDSHIFMGYDCAFQIQALRGGSSSETSITLKSNNAFTIRCLVNVGRVTSTSSSEYFGGESAVTVENCRKFIDCLKENHAEFRKIICQD